MSGQMEKELSSSELKNLLLRLCDEKALELVPDGKGNIYIPYFMNDAVEVYCMLTGTRIPGLLPRETDEITGVDFAENGSRRGIFLRKGEKTEATIWYEKCIYREQLYQYHRILHCWVSSCEHMRMLVYMLGTIWDKYKYLGPSACNAVEMELMPLMEYRGFRSFSPIEESIDSWYPETENGFDAILKFAKEADDDKLAHFLRRSRVLRFLSHRAPEQIAASGKLFEFIYRKICLASKEYSERIYQGPVQKKITLQRSVMHQKILEAGYKGDYPSYQKGDTLLTVMEEHPFTVPEMDDMIFEMHILERVQGTQEAFYRVYADVDQWLETQKNASSTT